MALRQFTNPREVTATFDVPSQRTSKVFPAFDTSLVLQLAVAAFYRNLVRISFGLEKTGGASRRKLSVTVMCSEENPESEFFTTFEQLKQDLTRREARFDSAVEAILRDPDLGDLRERIRAGLPEQQ